MENLLLKALQSLKNGQSCAFATVVESTVKGTPRKTGAKMAVFPDGSSFGTIGGGINEENAKKECLKSLKTGKSSLISLGFSKKDNALCGGQISIFIEPFKAKKDLIICGAGHIGLPLSIIGKTLGFSITIIDTRKQFANKKRFPHANRILAGPFKGNLSKAKINKNTLIVIVTHSHETDFECLKSTLQSDAAYVGVISSQAKREKFLTKIKSLGINKNLLKKVKMPTGLDIGAQTPEEIAISIAAEIISLNNIDTIGTDKFKTKNLKKRT